MKKSIHILIIVLYISAKSFSQQAITPVVSNYQICQNGVVPSGQGLNSGTFISHYSSSESNVVTNGPTYFRSDTVYLGGSSYLEPGLKVFYKAYTFVSSITGPVTFEVTAATFFGGDSFLSLYQNNFYPNQSSVNFLQYDDDDGPLLLSTITHNLIAGNTYTLVVSPWHSNTIGAYTIASSQNIFPVSTSIQWYTSPSGGAPIFTGEIFNPVGVAGSGIANTGTPGTTTFYVAKSTHPEIRTATTFTINPIPNAPTAAINQSLCGSGTLANIVATGTNLKWYDQAVGGNLLSNTTALTNTTYYVSQTISGCESSRTAVTVTLNPIPSAPTTIATQYFCESATVANLTATGTNLQWHDQAVGGNLLSNTTSLTTATYYVSNVESGCESTRIAVEVKANTTPYAPPVQNLCGSPTVANILAVGSNLIWYDAAVGGNVLASTTSLTNNTTYYVSQFVNTCTTESARTAVTVTINPIPDAPTAIATQYFCRNTTIENIPITGTNLKYYNAANTFLPYGTIMETGTYYISQTVNGCESARTAVEVNIKPVPFEPSIPSSIQTFCEHATLASLVAVGTNLKWYGQPIGGNLLSPETILEYGNYYVSQTVDGCESNRTSVSVVINYAPDSPTVIANQTFCYGATVANLVATGASLKWYVDKTGGAYLTSNTVLNTGNYYVSQTVNGCESLRNLVEVLITPLSDNVETVTACDNYTWKGNTYTTSGIYTGTTTNCITEKLNLTIIPSTENITTIAACTSYDWNGNTYTASGIFTGTTTNCVTEKLNLTILPSTENITTITTCDNYTWANNNQTYTESGIYTGTTTNCITEKLNLTINSTTWNGTSWSNGNPDNTKSAVFSDNYSETNDLTVCSIKVNGNAVVTIPSGFNFTVYGKITVAPTASLTFENNANLIQVNNVQNQGNITVKRNSNALMRLDYTMWSSPVLGQQLQSFSPATSTNRFYTYNSTTDKYNALTPTTNFEVGKGYLIRMPNNHPTTPTVWNGSFTGIPNNGNISVTAVNNTFNAIGNPYPSTIDAYTFITANALTEPLYFWRKTNNAASSSYATYTLAGGTANAGGLSSIVPNGTIQVGQGFIAKSTSDAFVFTNTMRTSNNNNQFLKTKAVEKHRIWLNLSKDATPINQMMVAYLKGATNGIDKALDGRFFHDSAIALNSIIDNEAFAIQAKGLPFVDSDVIPLTFKTNTEGNYSISIDHVDGLFSGNQDIYLNDKTTGTNHNLKNSEYHFTATAGTYNDRFTLVYKNEANLGINASDEESNKIIMYKQNGILNINAGTTIMKTIRVFDIQGRLIFKQEKLNQSSTILKGFAPAEQTILVQITAEDNTVVTKKVLF